MDKRKEVREAVDELIGERILALLSEDDGELWALVAEVGQWREEIPAGVQRGVIAQVKTARWRAVRKAPPKPEDDHEG